MTWDLESLAKHCRAPLEADLKGEIPVSGRVEEGKVQPIEMRCANLRKNTKCAVGGNCTMQDVPFQIGKDEYLVKVKRNRA